MLAFWFSSFQGFFVLLFGGVAYTMAITLSYMKKIVASCECDSLFHSMFTANSGIRGRGRDRGQDGGWERESHGNNDDIRH